MRSTLCAGPTHFGPFFALGSLYRAESVLSQGLDPWTQSLLLPLFTGVRRIGILRTSPFGVSRKFRIAPVQASMGLRWYDAGDMDE
jgi:hypothetical protein